MIHVFWILYRVALVITDISGNISPPSSRFLRVMGFHNLITVESVFINLSIEGFYVGPNNAVF
jgi:hypothetical protein